MSVNVPLPCLPLEAKTKLRSFAFGFRVQNSFLEILLYIKNNWVRNSSIGTFENVSCAASNPFVQYSQVVCDRVPHLDSRRHNVSYRNGSSDLCK